MQRLIQNALKQKCGSDFKNFLKAISKRGASDYNMKKAITYKENFMEALKQGASNFNNYELIKNKLEKMTPQKFYDFVKQSDILSDIFLWYKEGEGLIYGSFATSEEAFNYALEELKIFE